jgi:twitching motility two-component system response regulator PilG
MDATDINQQANASSGKATKTVLFIDDSPLVLETVKQLLENSPFDLITKNDSFAGLCELARNKPTAIFIDVNMSALNGYQFCALLKAQKVLVNFQYIPLILVLEYAGNLEQAKAIAAGASSVLVKPFGKSELLTAMKLPGAKAA